MRYHYEPGPTNTSIYAHTYRCNHPIYTKCTLYMFGEKGLAVIQQRYDEKSKHTWWADINPWLIDEIYMNPNFKMVFNEYAKEINKGIYPTMSIRQLMWKLRMKPLKRESWETVFDRCPI